MNATEGEGSRVQDIEAMIKHHEQMEGYHHQKRMELTRQSLWCPSCQKHYRRSEFTQDTRERLVHGELIDPDLVADVTYQDVYNTCPRGHHTGLAYSEQVKVENRRRRNG